MAAAIRSLGERLLAWGGAPEASGAKDDEIELQVHEKEEVELDVLDLKGRSAGDGGHIIDLAASSDSLSQQQGQGSLPDPQGDPGRNYVDQSELEQTPEPVCNASYSIEKPVCNTAQTTMAGRWRKSASWTHSRPAISLQRHR